LKKGDFHLEDKKMNNQQLAKTLSDTLLTGKVIQPEFGVPYLSAPSVFFGFLKPKNPISEHVEKTKKLAGFVRVTERSLKTAQDEKDQDDIKHYTNDLAVKKEMLRKHQSSENISTIDSKFIDNLYKDVRDTLESHDQVLWTAAQKVDPQAARVAEIVFRGEEGQENLLKKALAVTIVSNNLVGMIDLLEKGQI